MLGIAVLFAVFLMSVDAFITPPPDFLLPIDGNSVATGSIFVCAIEQKPGATIGGKVKCWGLEEDDKVMTDVPKDVSVGNFEAPLFLVNFVLTHTICRWLC